MTSSTALFMVMNLLLPIHIMNKSSTIYLVSSVALTNITKLLLI